MAEAFFRYVYRDKCDIHGRRIIEIADIEKGVKTCLVNVLEEVSKVDSCFKVKEILPTGSFYEETKIQIPDEFDYTVVLDTSVFAKSLEVVSICNSLPWFGQINTIPLENTNLDGDSFVANKEVGVSSPSEIERFFWARVGKIITKHPIEITTERGRMRTNFVSQHKLYLWYTESYTGEIPDDCNVERSSCKSLIPINTLDIGVDIMLAITHPDPDKIVELIPSQYHHLLYSKGCHFVTKSCHQIIEEPIYNSKSRCVCWCLSFAAIETELMKQLDDGHRKCYMVMKALMVGEANYAGKCMNLSSYMLKTAILYHVYGENPCSKMRYEHCIAKILEYLERGFEEVSMPCFFARGVNVWGKFVNAPVFESFEEYRRKEPNVNAMLWTEFWRRYVKIFKDTLLTASPETYKYEQQALIEKCFCFKRIVTEMMDEFFSAKIGQSSILVDNIAQEVWAVKSKFESIPTEVRKLFPTYIDEWQKRVDSKKIDFGLFVSIDSI